MKKIILGIIIGLTISFAVKQVYAEGKTWNFEDWRTPVERIQDGNINCYVLHTPVSGGISCVKVK